MDREAHLERFYTLLKRLENKIGIRKLAYCHGRMDWPKRGLYFFLSPDEYRDGFPRVTRVGTHAVSRGSSTTLWDRLITHRGTLRGKRANGGNHRGSIFRLRVGEAIIHRDGLQDENPSWGRGSNAPSDVKADEHPMELRVSGYIRELPFLWLEVDDEPGPDSDRPYIERNSIALLSNYGKTPIDERKKSWLGNHSPVDKIRRSGLWNSNHVDEPYDPAYLDVMEEYV